METAPCPCGGDSFGTCCGPILAGRPATGPEQVMRSRYTAFSLGDAHHLQESWSPRTRPDEMTLDETTEWLGLTVEEATEDGARGTVRFRARWRDSTSGERGELAEHSRFHRVAGRWYYLDAL